MRVREIKAIPNITPGFPPNKSRNPPCIKQSCKINPMILSSVFPCFYSWFLQAKLCCSP